MTPRPIEPRDVAQVHALIARCYAEYGLTLNLADECEAHIIDPGTYFRGRGGEFWVAQDEGGAVRATVAMLVHDGPERCAELKSMYVDAPWRRRGVGRALTLHVVDAAHRAGCTRLELWSDTRFEAAHRMYEALGFKRFGRRDIEDSNQSAEWGYRMELSGEVASR